MKIYCKDTSRLKKRRRIKITLVFLLKHRPATFTNKSCTTLQCRKKKSRSFTELFLVVKTIHPSLTWKKYATTIREILEEQNVARLVFCTGVQKVTLDTHFLYMAAHSSTMIPRVLYNYHVDYNFYKKGKGNHSISEILPLMGYTKKEIQKVKSKFRIKEKVTT
jgi:hypothetical protein|tara:strand:+ start:5547 stop:6038 length:492 start_codon:yes stop_codon:yes gene_type:complete